jgi:hypothetical protein
MKKYRAFFFLALFYSCADSVPDNSVDKDALFAKAEKKQVLSMFAPQTVYYTTKRDEDNRAWKEKNYLIFQSQLLDSVNHQQFELLDVHGDGENIVVFNQFFYNGDSVKHLILDTLHNFSDFADTVKDRGISVGVFTKEELVSINVKGIEKKAIISVVKMADNRQLLNNDIDSAIAKHKRQKKDPFEVIDVKRNNVVVLRAWFANTKTKKIELLKE